MGILDSAGILKLQEHFLSKGDQNKANPLRLSRALIVARELGHGRPHIKIFARLIETIDDAEINMNRKSRSEYLESLKCMLQENKFGEQPK
jgi:hypothetical protein